MTAKITSEDTEEKETICKIIGNKMKFVRNLIELSHSQVAKEAKMTTAHFINIEKGKVNISVATLCRLARVLHIDQRDLLVKQNYPIKTFCCMGRV
jgi:transcriptional regulator with XRE-family HTH domain